MHKDVMSKGRCRWDYLCKGPSCTTLLFSKRVCGSLQRGFSVQKDLGLQGGSSYKEGLPAKKALLMGALSSRLSSRLNGRAVLVKGVVFTFNHVKGRQLWYPPYQGASCTRLFSTQSGSFYTVLHFNISVQARAFYL
eukprot:3396521-Amphidinium_carterae.1